ncbi:hypothetical protein [Microtetraspora malaysiensis]|uniref:hypothetical protein n=1 Tax=Microtetraspora malaysiensis TaxID=161358 RepID=UPI003D93DB55
MVAAISREHLRRILRKGGVTWQTTTTWKSSTDPHFIAKMQRVLELYDQPPADGRVICLDEVGPLNLMPRKGKRWRPAGSPARLRATYNRYSGVMQVIAALDLATGQVVLPDPHAQALAGGVVLPQDAPRALAWPEAVCDRRQLLAPQTPPGPRLGCRQRC